jgi:hypothetical protein
MMFSVLRCLHCDISDDVSAIIAKLARRFRFMVSHAVFVRE